MIPRRGTWRHPGTREYYELDYFVVSPSLLPRIECIRTCAAMPFTDHFAKVLRVVIHGRDRAPPWWRLEAGLRPPPRLLVDRMSGPSQEAQAVGQSYAAELDARLAAAERPVSWSALSAMMVGAAETVCGRSRAARGPLGRLGHEEEASRERSRVAQLWEEVRESQGRPEEEERRQAHRRARAELQR